MISIALATYNGEKYILQQIDSILKQTYKDFELIICDDYSTDSTYSIVSDFSKNDKRIKCFKNETNLGFKKNFEKLVSLCNGEYIAFSDQDDVWTDNHLEVLLNSIGESYIACANAELIDKNGKSLQYTMKDVVAFDFIPEAVDKQFTFFLYSNFVQGSTMLVKTDFAKQLLPVPEFFKFHDSYFALMSTLQEVTVKYSKDIILKYRQHGNNVTENNNNYSIKNLFRIPDKKKFFAQQEDIKNKIIICDYILSINKRNEYDILINNAKRYYMDFLNGKYISNAMYRIVNYEILYLRKNNLKKYFFCIRIFLSSLYHQLFY